MICHRNTQKTIYDQQRLRLKNRNVSYNSDLDVRNMGLSFPTDNAETTRRGGKKRREMGEQERKKKGKIR